MAGWDWFSNAATRLTAREVVTVYGEIEDNFWEGREIEATSVYDFDRSTYYLSDIDPTLDSYFFTTPLSIPPEGTWMSVTGTVQKINGREFMLDTGKGTLKIDTLTMEFDPLDDVGTPQIETGDSVTISGRLDQDVFEKKEIQAKSIIKLSKEKKTSDQEQKKQ